MSGGSCYSFLDSVGDDLLLKILALLPTEDRARSEAVCKTWRRVSKENWSSITLRPITSTNVRAQFRWLRTLSTRSPSLMKSIDYCPKDSPGRPPMEVIGRFINLTLLNLRESWSQIVLTSSDMQHLTLLTNLEKLAIIFEPHHDGQVEAEDHPVVALAELAPLQNLTDLMLDFTKPPILNLAAEFEGAAKNLKALGLISLHQVVGNKAFKQLVNRLQQLYLCDVKISLSLGLQAKHLTSFSYIDCGNDRTKLPFETADNLRELQWSGPHLRPLVKADYLCNKLEKVVVQKALVTSHQLLQLSQLSSLKELALLGGYDAELPYTLHQLSRFTGLEQLALKLEKVNGKFAVDGILDRLTVLELAAHYLCKFDLGNGLQHLGGLRDLHMGLQSVHGNLDSESLEVLYMSYVNYILPSTSLEYLIPGNFPQLLGDLPRLHTLCLASTFKTHTETMVLALGLVGLRSLKKVFIFRREAEDLAFIPAILRALRNSGNSYDLVVLEDEVGEVVLKRSIMPSVRHLEIECCTVELHSACTSNEDLLYQTQSLRLRIHRSCHEKTSRTWKQFQECKSFKVQRMQRTKRFKPASTCDSGSPECQYAYRTNPINGHVYDYIEACHRCVGAIPPEFCSERICFLRKTVEAMRLRPHSQQGF